MSLSSAQAVDVTGDNRFSTIIELPDVKMQMPPAGRDEAVGLVKAFYGGIAFVIIQIVDGTFAVMGIPDWVSRLVIVLLALGFPVGMGLAWWSWRKRQRKGGPDR